VAVITSRPDPPALLRQELADMRARGIEWEIAWRTASARSLRFVHGENRDHWVGALSWSWPYFRAAYLGVQFDTCSRPIYPN
jgi:hypothetical protein